MAMSPPAYASPPAASTRPAIAPAAAEPEQRHRPHGCRPDDAGLGPGDQHEPDDAGRRQHDLPPPAYAECAAHEQEEPDDQGQVRAAHGGQVCQSRRREVGLDLLGQPGVVAVDPSVIPLGTRMAIPGYGLGIAADTGGAVVGSTIDVWFPTTAQALAWGRRTVTITVLG